MKRFVLQVGLVATVRVRAADETEARRVVPSVLFRRVLTSLGWPTITMLGWAGTQP